MKPFFHALAAAATLVFASACADHHHHHDHGTVGNGMGGQTVGSSYPSHHGAGHDDYHGSNARHNDPNQ